MAIPEQKTGRLVFPCAGAFLSFGRQKNIKERLEENTSEQLRLRTAIGILERAYHAPTIIPLRNYAYFCIHIISTAREISQIIVLEFPRRFALSG